MKQAYCFIHEVIFLSYFELLQNGTFRNLCVTTFGGYILFLHKLVPKTGSFPTSTASVISLQTDKVMGLHLI